MEIAIEEYMPYSLLTFLVLAGFYAVYFIKMLFQRRKGIRTNQIGSRKEAGLHRVEKLMGFATLFIVPVQLVSVILKWNMMPANGRFTGFFVGALGDLIFLISVMCMKDSWRAGIPKQDKTKLVTDGIYAYSRNPAFLGFDLQYVGVMLMYCNPLTILFTAFTMLMLHLQILQEEKYMAATFGEEYLQYKRQVFRYLGRKGGSVLRDQGKMPI